MGHLHCHPPSSPHGRSANSLSDRPRDGHVPSRCIVGERQTFGLSRSRRRALLFLKVKKKKKSKKKSVDGGGKREEFVKLHARWDMPEVSCGSDAFNKHIERYKRCLKRINRCNSCLLIFMCLTTFQLNRSIMARALVGRHI